ncbi:PH domain-containing protein [Streptomyces roseolus]|uniref:PH domain-containing protein n=1 Tax=Streptomyces roseolus TaxID=67358 RepID=UPI0016790D71|nr:PH domain-containing protein [Streptomyces roseolus]GGR37613.1 membrane protein [Streptomyces roseolus]
MTSPTPSEPNSGSNPEPTSPDRVYRSNFGIAGGVFLLALALVFAGDALVRGEGRTPWLALAGLLLAVPLITAFTLRPAVQANEDRLRIRNPFRSIVLPWAAVADVRAGYSSEVFTHEGAKYQLWAMPVSLRQRKRAARQAARASQDDPHGRTSVTADVRDSAARVAAGDQNVADLREMAERHQGRAGAQGTPTVRWAYEIIAPAAVGLLLLVVLGATG